MLHKLITPETGEEVVTTDTGLEAFLDLGYTRAPEAEEAKEPTWPTSHADLDALAEKLGVTFPAPEEGKKKLTVAEKIAALEAAGHTPGQDE